MRWITADYITGWALIALSAVTLLFGCLVYRLKIHDSSLWTLIFDLADVLVFARR